jgi:hypothetical protein
MSDEEESDLNFIDQSYMPADKRSQYTNGYQLDAGLSDQYTAVYNDPNRGPVVVYRGTKDQTDLGPDINILFGVTWDKRFTEARVKEQQVHKKYGVAPLLLGHSLGGSLAHHVARNTNNQARIYNPGSSPFFQQKVESNVKVVRSKYDLISQGYAPKTAESNYIKSVYASNSAAAFLGTAMSHGTKSLRRSQPPRKMPQLSHRRRL